MLSMVLHRVLADLRLLERLTGEIWAALCSLPPGQLQSLLAVRRRQRRAGLGAGRRRAAQRPLVRGGEYPLLTPVFVTQ
jgi:hypothetical protein